MGRRVIDGPDCSRFLIDVPTGILINCRSKDITPAIGSVNSQPLPVLPSLYFFIIMSNVFTSIFNNDARAEGVRSLHAARGRDHHCSILDYDQIWAARQAAAHREVTPFDFNIGRYQVSLLQMSCRDCKIDLQS